MGYAKQVSGATPVTTDSARHGNVASSQSALQGRVARILNERELVINIGSDHGVVEGMRFAVLAATPDLVTDPDTGDELGELDPEKVHVEAIEVHPRMTVCSTYRTRWVGSGQGLGNLTEFLQPRRQVTETLRADEGSRPRVLSPEDAYVKVGDRVRLARSEPRGT
jgi:hypothetical protein